jgi:hypothetical protein
VTVRHFQGAATGFERWRPNRRMYNFRRDSHMYYVREYLGRHLFHSCCLWIAVELGYVIRYVAWILRGAGRLLKNVSRG